MPFPDIPRCPPRLRPGDLVAVCAPSGPARFPERLARGVAALREMGFAVTVGPLVGVADDSCRTPRMRADELNSFLRDPAVRAVVAAIGGYTTNGILDLVDWDALRADPKIVVGYSDITALLLGVVREAGVVAFHGPTVLPELAEFPTVLAGTRAAFLRATTSAEPLGRVCEPASWTEEFLAWGRDDVRPRRVQPGADPTWLGTGEGAGRLLGGNLETLCALAGTRYFPDTAGAVLLLESAGSSLDSMERDIEHLRMLGALDRPAGLVVGHSFRGGPGFESEFRRRMARWFSGAPYPIVVGVHIGHTDPMPTLPLGVRARLDAAAGAFVIVDPAVR